MLKWFGSMSFCFLIGGLGMLVERLLFNMIILLLIVFVVNRYFITQKVMFLIILFGQFFALVLEIAVMINNVQSNLVIQMLTSILGVIIPGAIFFSYHFRKGSFHVLFGMGSKKYKGINWDSDEILLLTDGSTDTDESEDTYKLAKEVRIFPEKGVDDILKGYNMSIDKIPLIVKNTVEETQKLLNRRAYRKVLDLYLSIEKQGSDNPVLQYNIGNMYYRLKDYSNAIDRYNRALAINKEFEKPRHSQDKDSSNGIAAKRIKNILKKVEDYEIVFNIAVCLLARGKYDKAIETFKEAGELKGNWIHVYRPLGIIYEKLKRYPEAVDMYKNLIEIDQADFEICKKTADFLCKLGDYKQAKKYYDIAVKFQPDFVEGYINLGNCLLNSENYEEAITAYQEAIRINPNNSLVHYNLGIALYNSGKKMEALNEYKKAIELNPHDYNSYYNLGVILDELGMKEEAVSAFEECLEIRPDFYEASNNLAITLCSLKRYNEALDTYIKALQFDPFNHELYFNLAVTLEYQGQIEYAEEVYHKIIKMKPDFSDAYFNLGLIKCNKGELEAAEELLRTAVEYDNHNHKAFYQLARIYAMQREYGRCIYNLERAVSLSKEYIFRAKSDKIFDSIRNLKSFENVVGL